MWGRSAKFVLRQFFGRSLTRSFQSNFSISSCRPAFLSPEYDCQSAWEKRLESNLLKKLELEDFFNEIERKYVTEKFISAIDVDLYVNKVTEIESLEEMEELTYRLRKSPVTHQSLPSTSYAFIRSFLIFDKTEELMRILNDRLNYGVFPDHYTSNLLMDTFLARKNYKDAARIASLLMLDENFGLVTTQLFALLSCLKHLEEGIPESWEVSAKPDEADSSEQKPPAKREKKPEEERVRVHYLRNVYFDDHFDLTDPKHIVGKTLAYLSFEFREDELLRRSIELLGWALFDKWDKVESSLKKFIDGKQIVSSEVIKTVTEMANSRLAQIESSPDKTIPLPKMRGIPGMNLEPKEISKAFEKLKWSDSFKPLGSVKELLSSSKIQTGNMNLINKTEELLAKVVAANEKLEIEDQLNNFKNWEELRVKELNRQLTRYREEQTLFDIERKKKELREKEDTIFFFDNEEKWMMQQPPPEPVPDPTVKVKGGKPVEDMNYIPPQIKPTTGHIH